MRSGIRAIRNFARRISREADYIAHAISLKLTHATIESFNRKIAELMDLDSKISLTINQCTVWFIGKIALSLI